MWILCRIDVREALRGRESARWVIGFAERVLAHDPWSIARAKRQNEQDWPLWFGYTTVASRLVDLTDVVGRFGAGRKWSLAKRPTSRLKQPKTLVSALGMLAGLTAGHKSTGG